MLKMIKTTKQMRLDELIKHVRENDIRKKAFVTDLGRASVYFDIEQKLSFMDINRIFTVEVEEEITEDMVFSTLVDVNNNDEVHITRNVSISLYDKEQTKEIHAIVNGKLELVWKRDEE